MESMGKDSAPLFIDCRCQSGTGRYSSGSLRRHLSSRRLSGDPALMPVFTDSSKLLQ